MKHSRISRALLHTALTAGALWCSSLAWAQQAPSAPRPNAPQAPAQPLPPLPDGGGANAPLGALGAGPEARSQTGSSAQAQPDTHVLAGGELLGLAALPRHVIDPALEVSEFGQTGIFAGKTLSVSHVGGSVGVAQRWKRYDLIFTYDGAETFYQPYYYNGLHNLPYQQGAIAQEFFAGRWTFRLRDDALYSWGPAFGSLFAAGPALAGQNNLLDSIQPSLAAGGTIQTALARQFSDTALGEIDYAHSRRTTLTLLASFGLMKFLDPGYVDNQNLTGRVGYNYALSAKNSIALTYDHSRINFIGAAGRLQTDLAEMEFARKVTGRLSFQVAAGPQLIHSYFVGSAQTRQLSWSATSSLTYQWRHTGYSLSYFRGVTAGSGVLFGSSIQTVTATASHEFTRFWSGSVHGGYALNKALITGTSFASRFDDWFAGVDLNRQIGRQVRLGLSYGFQQQTSGNGICPVLSCGLARPFSEYGVTLSWHPFASRPAERTSGAAFSRP
jgi:hypothetical protein